MTIIRDAVRASTLCAKIGAGIFGAAIGVGIALVAMAAHAQGTSAPTVAPAPPPTQPPLGTVMDRLSGVWVEGPGFDITYGGNYEACAKKCLGHARCVMIEYYRPEKKCNMYDTARPRKPGGSSDVAIRR